LGLSFIICAVQGKWAFSLKEAHPAPSLIVLEVFLAIACFGWAWWIREQRLRRETAAMMNRARSD
jgi:hypothetical protein